MTGQYNSPNSGQYSGQGPGYPPPGGYGQQPPPGQYGGPPGQYGPPPGYSPPGYPPPYPPEPPRPNRRKQVFSWLAVLAGGTAATVIAALLINGTDGKKNEAVKLPPTESVRKLESFDPKAVQNAPSAPPASKEASRPSAPPAPKSGGKFAPVATDMSTWPDVCDLITPEEIAKVIPEVTTQEEQGTAKAAGSYASRGPALRSTTCLYTVNTKRGFGYSNVIKLTIEIRNIDAPKELDYIWNLNKNGAQRIQSDFKAITAPGVDDAYYAVQKVRLRKGQYDLQVDATGSLTMEGTDRPWMNWQSELLPKFVATISAKI
ncbi:hypothetical protein ACIRL2_28710 [Embleya sp. NPDC127516]|uniref:hypothetical protein n=1 Tax=Embleya sp. NPDC127516 TaxID=3363990 RepID=UPI0038206B28